MTEINLNKIQEIILESSGKARRDSIARRRSKDLSRPSASWTTDAKIGDDTGRATSIVLATVGCSYARGESGGCTMCSYLLDGTEKRPTSEQLVLQFASVLSSLSGEGPLSIKLYTSGSFLDEDEVSLEARNDILHKIAQDNRITEVVIESRPEYVTDETMVAIRRILGGRLIEIGIGLESSNDRIRSICINKGFTLADFKEALKIASKHDIGVRAYVLLKPPFLSESSALQDTLKTIQDCSDLGVSTVSLNPVNVQKNTLVESLWERGEYRPAWLWTLVEVLMKGRASLDKSVKLVCDPVAGGKSRGVHNCRVCDKKIVQAIRTFSLSQDTSCFESLECECTSQWKHVLEHEEISLLVHSDRRLS